MNRMAGIIDKTFLERINGQFICLIAACLAHSLRNWDKDDNEKFYFRHDNVGGKLDFVFYWP